MSSLPTLRKPASVLAFDTSTEWLVAAVQHGGRSATLRAEGGAAASATLLPQLHTLLARAGCTLADIDAIAFGRGPGAFTGLRTACAVAQGLGLGLGRPLVPVDSLLIVAEDARAQAGGLAGPGGDVGVVMDARMDEAYAALYRWRAGAWQVLQPPALYTLAALAQAWAGKTPMWLAGSALAAFGDRLVLPPARRLLAEQDRPDALLRLAVQAAQAGEGIDPGLALPLYLRDQVALTTAEREARRLAPRGPQHPDRAVAPQGAA
jgi:tRNA threonylcarbamoyladenosine biosynthesis protein TsaB